MVRGLIIGMCLLAGSVSAQRELYVRPGLLSSSLTISPTFMLNRDESSYYLTGFLEGKLDNHLSFRGETHYHVGGSERIPYFKLASRTHFGIQYHLNKGNLDGYIGLMPGFMITQVNNDFNSLGENPVHVVPSFSTNIGVSYYVWKVVHFFANVTYVHSTVNEVRDVNSRADELMISAGLGFNINAVKQKKK